MTLSGVLSSPSQKRSFLLATSLLIVLSLVTIFSIALALPKTPFWDAFNNLLMSVAASGIFAITAAIYMGYFFTDPYEEAAKSFLPPQDIGGALKAIAEEASEYRIFVRTGRHFRADVLPILLDQARLRRSSIRVEVILLDFRDDAVCRKYSDFRRSTVTDQPYWNVDYVKREIAATIVALGLAVQAHPGLIDVDLYLSARLSTFRIEGSSNAILITREDPKDPASRYLDTHRDFSAYQTELRWIREDAYKVNKNGNLPPTLVAMFGQSTELSELEASALTVVRAPSPYAR